jgi:hypothetical protein
MAATSTPDEVVRLYYDLMVSLHASDQAEANRIYNELIGTGRHELEVLAVLAKVMGRAVEIVNQTPEGSAGARNSYVLRLPNATSPKNGTPPTPASLRYRHIFRWLALAVPTGIFAIAYLGYFSAVEPQQDPDVVPTLSPASISMIQPFLIAAEKAGPVANSRPSALEKSVAISTVSVSDSMPHAAVLAVDMPRDVAIHAALLSNEISEAKNPLAPPVGIHPNVHNTTVSDITVSPIARSSIDTSDFVKRGDELIRIGDISSGRLHYERAANSGNGQAALRLGQTYDPAFLAYAGIQGVRGDSDMANLWYQTARYLGEAQADALLVTPPGK